MSEDKELVFNQKELGILSDLALTKLATISSTEFINEKYFELKNLQEKLQKMLIDLEMLERFSPNRKTAKLYFFDSENKNCQSNTPTA